MVTRAPRLSGAKATVTASTTGTLASAAGEASTLCDFTLITATAVVARACTV